MSAPEVKIYPKNICQQFFHARLIEILHIATLDSYRVRTHNAHTLVSELLSLIEQWRNGNIKQFETVELCARETKTKIENDPIYLSDYPHKKILSDYLESFIKEGKTKPSFCERIKHLLEDLLIASDSKSYIDNTTVAIRDLTTLLTDDEHDENYIMERLRELDSLISSLCSELISVGFSKSYLYTCAKQFDLKNFDTAFDKFVALINLDNRKDYVIIFKLSVSRPEMDIELPDITKAFPDEYKIDWIVNRRPNFISARNDQRFYTVTVKSHDEFSAIKQAKEKLSNHLDRIHFALHNSKIMPLLSALVLAKKGSHFHVYDRSTLPILDGVNQGEQERLNIIQDRLNSIQSSNNITIDVTNRINAALRHLRIGDADTEIEQRFINYWIALEFLFSTPIASDSTFGRIKENLVSILVSCYGKRNLLAIDYQIEELAKDIEIPHIWEKGAIEKIKSKIQLPILLEYRLNRYQTHLLSNKDNDIRRYLELHKQNVSWQIARIYRLRNELIHEAAIKQDIESLASNLRYYLIFVLNQAVRFFSQRIGSISSRKYNMESFFMHYDLMRTAIEKKPSLQNILSYGDFEEKIDGVI